MQKISVRLDDDLLKALDQAVATEETSRSNIVVEALKARLGKESKASLADLEARVKALEDAVLQSPTRRTTLSDTVPSSRASSALLPAAGEGLTTTEAWQYCQQRGYRGSKAAFRSWAKRNPAALRQQFSLEPTGYAGKSNTAPSYRKVQ